MKPMMALMVDQLVRFLRQTLKGNTATESAFNDALVAAMEVVKACCETDALDARVIRKLDDFERIFSNALDVGSLNLP